MSAPPAARSAAFFRWAAIAGLVLATALSFALRAWAGERAAAAAGVLAFLFLAASCSSDLRAVRWRPVAWGFVLQAALAVVLLKVEIGGVRPGYAALRVVGEAAKRFLEFTGEGSRMVFGALADPAALARALGPEHGYVFAFSALPTIIFVAAFFTVLYHFGILQWVVGLLARVMMAFLGTSGAETLVAAANIFMGHTEAPLIVRPYVPRMTRSELFAVMTCGLATLAAGVMAVYISLGVDPIGLLVGGAMSAPAGLYLAKILVPETEEPVTRGSVRLRVEREHANVIDALAGGATVGVQLAINVVAMLIAFLASVALVNFLLRALHPALSLQAILSFLFWPVAALMGVAASEVRAVADLLCTKLVINEFVSYLRLTTEYQAVLSERTRTIATFALAGFANVGSVGMLLGALGGMAPEKRGELARLGWRAMFAGFLVTVVNAAIVAVLI